MAWELTYGLMVPTVVESGLRIKFMGSADTFGAMGVNMKVIGRTIK